MSAVLASAAAGAAVWWSLSGLPDHRRLRPEACRGRAHARAGRGGAGWLALAMAGPATGALGWGMAGVVGGAALGMLLLTAAAIGVRRAGRARRASVRAEVAEAAALVAGLLRAGRVPSVALREAALDSPLLAPVAAELAAGGDAVAALRRDAVGPGREGLAHLADAWLVAQRTGAGLARAWEGAADSLAADQEVARVVAAEVASARAGSRVMAGLPIVGAGLGHLLGGDPVQFLLGHPVGWACLLGGVGLGCVGVLWADQVSDRAGGS